MVASDFRMMAVVPQDEVETVQGYEDLTYIARPIGNYVLLAYDTLELPEHGPNPVADRNLRYAMTAAIDRQALEDALWGGDTVMPAPSTSSTGRPSTTPRSSRSSPATPKPRPSIWRRRTTTAARWSRGIP